MDETPAGRVAIEYTKNGRFVDQVAVQRSELLARCKRQT